MKRGDFVLTNLAKNISEEPQELCQFEPLEFEPAAPNVGKVILRLLHQPALFGAAENLGEPHSHFRRYAALPVHEFRKSVAGYAESFGGVRDRQAIGSMHSSNTTTPGCGGVFIVIGLFRSVVIDIINVLRSVVKTKYHSPVGAYCNGPKAFHLTLEGMRPKSRQVHMGNAGGGVKRRQNVPQFANVFRVYAARVVLFEQAS